VDTPKASAAELDLVAGDPRTEVSSFPGALSSPSPSKNSSCRIIELVAMLLAVVPIDQKVVRSVEVEARQLLYDEVEPLDGSAIVVFVVAGDQLLGHTLMR